MSSGALLEGFAKFGPCHLKIANAYVWSMTMHMHPNGICDHHLPLVITKTVRISTHKIIYF